MVITFKMNDGTYAEMKCVGAHIPLKDSRNVSFIEGEDHKVDMKNVKEMEIVDNDFDMKMKKLVQEEVL